MAFSSSAHLSGRLTSEENSIMDEAISRIPDCTLQLTARATVLSEDVCATGALALVRIQSTNGFAVLLFDTTQGDVLWQQALSPHSDFQSADNHSQCHRLTDGGTGVTIEIIFADGQESDAFRLQRNISKACRRLTKRLKPLTGPDTSTSNVISPSSEEANSPFPIQITKFPETLHAVSAPGAMRWSSTSTAPQAAGERRRKTAPAVMDPFQCANSSSDGRNSDSTEKVESWLECSEPVTCSAPPRTAARSPTEQFVETDHEHLPSSYPDPSSPTRTGSHPIAGSTEDDAIRSVQRSSRKSRRRRPWKAVINGRTYEIMDVTYALTYTAGPKDAGGFGFIRRGKLNGQDVAIKQIKPGGSRVFSKKIKMKDSKRYRREVVIAMLCARLRHPNIVQFDGVAISNDLGACLVFPWMKNGNSLQYIKTSRDVPRVPLIHGTLKGLEFLHRHCFVHNDLKAYNVLVSDEGIPLIADFGLATHEDLDGEQPSLSILRAGNARWQAPELQGDHNAKKTMMSDMWAFAMFAIEIMTEELPFPRARSAEIVIAVQNHNLPARPAHPECTDALWNLIQRCWDRIPEERITALDALRLLDEFDENGRCSSSQ